MSTRQTPAPDPRREQAEKLRMMAGYEQAKAKEWERHSVAPVPPCGYSNRGCAQASQNCAASSAALLAGAAALEALEVAKAALKPFGAGVVIECIENEDFSIMRERIVDWHGPSDFRAAAAALARLEAL